MGAVHLVLALSVCAAVYATTTAARAVDPLDAPGFPAAAGVQLKDGNTSPATITQIHDMGFGVIRKGVYWSTVEKTKGVYDFSAYDQMFATAHALGMTVSVTLYGNNTLYENDGSNGITTAAGRDGFAHFAAALVNRYQNDDVVWEIWNEPNTKTFWDTTAASGNTAAFAQQYTALVQRTMTSVLAADPHAFVVAGSVSSYWQPSYNWTQYCFQDGILQTGIKGWSVHPYGISRPEDAVTGHTQIRTLLTQYGAPDLPLLDTEHGFTVSEAGDANQQAAYLVREYLVDQINRVPMTVWYEWSTTTSETFALYRNGQSTPAAVAAGVMLDQLAGYHYVERLPSAATDYLVLFADGQSHYRLVAWTTQSGHDVLLPVDVTAPLDVRSLDGVAGQITPVAGSATLALSGAPLYLTLPAAVPEPASLALLGAAAAITLPRRRR